jgi:hypothetical protein
MKRKLKWPAIVLAVSLLGFGTALLLWPRDRITAASWKRIRVGMTEKEVEGILGRPGINREEYEEQHEELTKTLDQGAKVLLGFLWNPQIKTQVWIGDRGIGVIQYAPGGHVGRILPFVPIKHSEPSFIDRLRDWLGL